MPCRRADLRRDRPWIPANIDPGEPARRIRAFNDDFHAIRLTVTLHGMRFRLPYLDV
jgi:hypothetical protein